MNTVDLLYKAADVIVQRGQPSNGRACNGRDASASDPLCLVCALCVASGCGPGVVTEPVKDAMWMLAEHLGLKLPGDLWDWDASRHRASWFLAAMLRCCAKRKAGVLQ